MFGLVGLAALLVLIVAAIVKSDVPEVRNALLLMAAVLLGAVIAVESIHRRGGDDDHR